MFAAVLADQRLNPELIRHVLYGVQEDQERELVFDHFLAGRLSSMFAFDPRLPGEARILSFAGVTGVGRATLIAQVAHHLHYRRGMRIGIISSEQELVGERYPLSIFGEQHQLSVQTVRGGNAAIRERRYHQALQDLHAMEMVLVDCHGDSEVAFAGQRDAESIVVVSGSASERELLNTARRYRGSSFHRLAITRLDQCGCAGPIAEALLTIDLPIAFFSHGESPRALEPASAHRLAQLLTRVMH